MGTLAGREVASLDPYALMAVIGKRVIHPGGRKASRQLLEWADVQSGERVLDVGCGVGGVGRFRSTSAGNGRVISANQEARMYIGLGTLIIIIIIILLLT